MSAPETSSPASVLNVPAKTTEVEEEEVPKRNSETHPSAQVEETKNFPPPAMTIRVPIVPKRDENSDDSASDWSDDDDDISRPEDTVTKRRSLFDDSLASEKALAMKLEESAPTRT